MAIASKLMDKEFRGFEKRIKEFKTVLNTEPSKDNQERHRDYQIYKECVHTAFFNDLEANQEPKITDDEKSILITLADQLELSNDEVRLIEGNIVGFQKPDVDSVIKDLKEYGILFLVKRDNRILVPDEFVRLLRRVRGIQVADKFFRRVLRHLRDSEINQIARKHNIDRSLSNIGKIEVIINEGVDFVHCLLTGMHKTGTNKSEIRSTVNRIIEKGLKFENIRGSTAEDKVKNLIKYFDELDRDPKVIISVDGYDKLLVDLDRFVTRVKQKVRNEFQLQDEEILNSKYLLDHNIKPQDVLYLLNDVELLKFCRRQDIKTRGDLIHNILKNYKDTGNLFIENYHLLAYRDWKGLRENGIVIKEADLGLKFESVTKDIFKKLGFNVDEDLRKKLNTAKDKMDIVLNLESNNLILVECKSYKGGSFGKYSSVSRQIKSYNDLAKRKGFMVLNSLLVAPEFTDDFVKDCGLEIELNLSLIAANSLKKILAGFKDSNLDQFPYTLFTKDVVIKAERILKAISR